jgi:hypothetical protein
MPLSDRVVRRFLAGVVVPFKPKPGVPVLAIGGRKYALSTDGGPLGDREDDEDVGWFGDTGARIIRPPPGTNKWRYLWAYDTNRQMLTMWRVSDGSEKLHDSAHSQQGRIVALEKKGQLNRVTSAEYTAIEKEMRRREDDTMQAMKESLAAAKTDAQKRLDVLVAQYYDEQILPRLTRALDAVHAGVVPLGFKPFGDAADGDPASLLRQRCTYVMGQVFQREMTVERVEEWLTEQDFPFSLVDPQDIDWAIDDVQDAAYTDLLPPRP